MNEQNRIRRVVIIGGGISGLSAAHRIVEIGGDGAQHTEVLVLEAQPRIGGAIETRHEDGFLLEGGPDAFITQKPWALQLCRRMGVDDELIPTNEEHRRAFIARRGRLHPIPEGFMLLAPTRMLPFAFSRLFSWPGKIRMGMDLLIPRGSETGDESLASFVRRRLGREALDRVAQPLVSGIYAADPETLSLRTTMPRFLDMESKYRSLILGLRAGQKAMGAQAKKTKKEGGASYSIFATMRQGMAALVDAVAARLPEGSVRTGCSVKTLTPLPGRDGWQVDTGDSEPIVADAVIVAAPAFEAARMLAAAAPDVAARLRDVEYTSTLTVNFAFDREAIAHPLDAFGLVVPASEEMAMIGASFCHVKYPGRAPQQKALIRAFVGGSLNPWAYDMDDADVERRVLQELDRLIGIKSKPRFATIHRWPKSMAQFRVGHLDRVKETDATLAAYPPAAVAGNAFAGGGVPDCIHRGEWAADYVFGRITGKQKQPASAARNAEGQPH